MRTSTAMLHKTMLQIICAPNVISGSLQNVDTDFVHNADWMVGQVGFEPTANWLRANCSTTELLTHAQCAV